MDSARSEDCPALSVCKSLGNARISCGKGGVIEMNDEMMTQRCMASLILLIDSFSRAAVRVHLSSEPAPPDGGLTDSCHNETPGKDVPGSLVGGC